jgi:hypothetical protein
MWCAYLKQEFVNLSQCRNRFNVISGIFCRLILCPNLADIGTKILSTISKHHTLAWAMIMGRSTSLTLTNPLPYPHHWKGEQKQPMKWQALRQLSMVLSGEESEHYGRHHWKEYVVNNHISTPVNSKEQISSFKYYILYYILLYTLYTANRE